MVLRPLAASHVYSLAPVGCTDDYWAGHLEKNPQVAAKVLMKPSEKVPGSMELLRRWKVLSEPGEETEKSDLAFLGKTGVEYAVKTLAFVRENVVSDQVARQEWQRSQS